MLKCRRANECVKVVIIDFNLLIEGHRAVTEGMHKLFSCIFPHDRGIGEHILTIDVVVISTSNTTVGHGSFLNTKDTVNYFGIRVGYT